MGADACPVPEGKGSWLFMGLPMEKLATEAPVNGGRNSDGFILGLSLKIAICWNTLKANETKKVTRH